jgi:hypothetical protein
MDVPEPLVVAAIIGAAGTLGGNTVQLIRLTQDMKHVKKRLPNGEIDVMYKMLRKMYKKEIGFDPEMEEEFDRVERAVNGGAEYDDI